MVPRLLTPRLLGSRRLLAACGSALAALVLAPGAAAANHKVAIGDFRWSTPEVHVNLGEHVTWYWVGPDTQHSVTGISAGDTNLDSDKGRAAPDHRLGDRFRLTFDHPGVYSFQCKLHSIVRGTVVVDAAPGDPPAEPDPDPPLAADIVPPELTDVRLERPTFRRATDLLYTLDERATIDAELYRLGPGRRRTYAGYETLRGHIGYNDAVFSGRGRRRAAARPGRYEALLYATDASANEAPVVRLRFTVAG